MAHTSILGEEKITKLLLNFSLPAVIAMVVNSIYMVIDRIFVGNSVGSLGIAGITIGFPIMIISMACMMLVGMGANALVSIRLGEQKKDEAELILGNALILLIVVSIGMSVIGIIFLEPTLKTFGASQEVLPYAVDFMTIILVGTIFQGIGFGMNNFIRGEGNPKTAMATMVVAAVLNAVLCPIFIFGLGWGIKGSALATVIAQAVSAAWVMQYFLFGKSTLKIRKKNLKLDRNIVFRAVSLGAAPFAMELAFSLSNAILNKSLSYYGGDIAISGMGIIMSVNALIIMPIIGISQGAQPIIGYNFGAQKYDRVKDSLKIATFMATALGLIGLLAIQIFPRQIVGLFNNTDQTLIRFSVYAIRVVFNFPSDCRFPDRDLELFPGRGQARTGSDFKLITPATAVGPCGTDSTFII